MFQRPCLRKPRRLCLGSLHKQTVASQFEQVGEILQVHGNVRLVIWDRLLVLIWLRLSGFRLYYNFATIALTEGASVLANTGNRFMQHLGCTICWLQLLHEQTRELSSLQQVRARLFSGNGQGSDRPCSTFYILNQILLSLAAKHPAHAAT